MFEYFVCIPHVGIQNFHKIAWSGKMQELIFCRPSDRRNRQKISFLPVFSRLLPELASEKYVDAMENSEKFRGTCGAENYFFITSLG